MDTDSPTKTVASEREITLGEPIVAALKAIKPLHVTENDFVFKNQEGNPIIEDKWRAKYWYRALRACGIRARKFYATRHTFISVGLSQGVKHQVASRILRDIGGDDREALRPLY